MFHHLVLPPSLIIKKTTPQVLNLALRGNDRAVFAAQNEVLTGGKWAAFTYSAYVDV
jgi:hypothetical protein